jgi:hypothetical protein
MQLDQSQLCFESADLLHDTKKYHPIIHFHGISSLVSTEKTSPNWAAGCKTLPLGIRHQMRIMQ